MNDAHYGWIVNCHYDWINMLNRMKEANPKRFDDFQYKTETIYYYLDRIQQEQNLYD